MHTHTHIITTILTICTDSYVPVIPDALKQLQSFLQTALLETTEQLPSIDSK